MRNRWGEALVEKLLSPEEVAELLGVTPNTVRAWLRDGSLKGIKLGRKNLKSKRDRTSRIS